MSLLPDIKEGVLVSVVIPYEPKKQRKLSKGFLHNIKRMEDKAKRKRKQGKQKKHKFVTQKYQDYVKSQAWRNRRQAFFKKYGKECAICRSTFKVGVHHISYQHLGRELDEELVALCWTHHAAYHHAEGVKRDNLSTHSFIEDERQMLEFSSIARNF